MKDDLSDYYGFIMAPEGGHIGFGLTVFIVIGLS